MKDPTKVAELRDHPGMPKEVPNIGPEDIIKGTLHGYPSEFGPMDSGHCSIGWARVIFSKHGIAETNEFSSLFIKGLACSILRDPKARDRIPVRVDLTKIDERAKDGPDGLTMGMAQRVVITHNDSSMTSKQDIADLLNNGLSSLGYDTPSSTLLESKR